MGWSRPTVNIDAKTEYSWSQDNILYLMRSRSWNELLKTSETVTGARYRQLHLYNLKRVLNQKRPQVVSKRQKVILLHDNARPHVAVVVKQTLLELEWEVLPHPARILQIWFYQITTFSINATRAWRYTFFQFQRSAKIYWWTDWFKRRIVLLSQYPSLARKMGKNCSKQRKIFWLM